MTGYVSKKAMAEAKLEDDDTQVYQDHDDALTIAYQSGYYDGKKAAQRPWVGLTEEEFDAIYLQHHNQYGECESPNWGYERAIEAALRSKNT